MKTSHIIGISVIALALVFIISTISDSSTYATFSDAAESPEETFHVVGRLVKEKPQDYRPEVNANVFSFYMIDNEGKERKVILNQPKPQDFDKSEQIVVIGICNDKEFKASSILMKCPSKYNNPKDQNPEKMMGSN
ncbi:MAG: cytochrome c maturation protein CcmE [Bacteroidota bacterium]